MHRQCSIHVCVMFKRHVTAVRCKDKWQGRFTDKDGLTRNTGLGVTRDEALAKARKKAQRHFETIDLFNRWLEKTSEVMKNEDIH